MREYKLREGKDDATIYIPEPIKDGKQRRRERRAMERQSKRYIN